MVVRVRRAAMIVDRDRTAEVMAAVDPTVDRVMVEAAEAANRIATLLILKCFFAQRKGSTSIWLGCKVINRGDLLDVISITCLQ